MTALIKEMVMDALPELFVEKNVVMAGQAFHRRLAEYEMNIEQQKLLREDLRDLVELTIGRMDIYHLVGALLLEFTVHLFCENHLLVEAEEHELPRWVLTFFLLSNLCAAGYLVMAVWLSMHASVASHSIGVKLLTNSARLSIPTRKELEEVCSVPLIGLMERVQQLGQRFGFTKKEEKQAEPETVAPAPAPERSASRMERLGSRMGKALSLNAVPRLDAGMFQSTDSHTGNDAMPVRLNPNMFRSTDSGTDRRARFESAASDATPLKKQARNASNDGSGFQADGAQELLADPVVAAPMWQSEGLADAAAAPQQRAHFAACDDTGGISCNFLDAPTERAIDEGAKASADKTKHFRLFLEEQRKWVNYDAYARVCMSLGINQMLTALSYYLIGTFALKAPRSALISLLGIQLLSLLLLRLDLVPGENARSDATRVFFLVPLPPVYLALLLCTWDVHMVSERFLSIMALPAFCLHSGWLLLVAFVFIPHRGGDNSMLPTQLRTVLFLDVITPDQDDSAEQEVTGEAEAATTDRLADARLQLQAAMTDVMEEEADAGYVRKANRTTADILQLEEAVQEVLEIAESEQRMLEARKREASKLSAEDAEELRKNLREYKREIAMAKHALDHFDLWRMAPDVYAGLAALKSMTPAGWYDEEKKSRIERSYRAFLERCKELGLGIVAPPKDGSYCFFDADSPTSRLSIDTGLPLAGLEVAEDETLMVRVPAPDLCGGTARYTTDESVWVEQGSSRLRHHPPEDHRATSFSRVLDNAVPEFSERVMRLMQSRGDITVHTPTMASCLEGQNEVTSPVSPAARRRNSTMSRRTTGKLPTALSLARSSIRRRVTYISTPAEQLPGVLVRRWSLGLGLLWIVGAFLHSFDYGHHRRKVAHAHGHADSGHGQEHGKDAHYSRIVARRRLFMAYSQESILEPQAGPGHVPWPEPARLFEVVSMQCSGSRITVDSGFHVFMAERGADGSVGDFEEVAESGPLGGALLCGPDGCELLARFPGSWTLATLGAEKSDDRASLRPAPLRLPESWRRVAATRVPCAGSSCVPSLALAGWDGVNVVVADASLSPDDSGELEWRVRTRYSLQPAKDPCPGADDESCHAAWASDTEYRHVEAIHFGPGGRTLAVLTSNSSIDAWDLHLGSRLGRWMHPEGGGRRRPQHATPPHAMCHDGSGFLFAHAALGAGGPRLSAAKLPEKLQVADDWQAAWMAASAPAKRPSRSPMPSR